MKWESDSNDFDYNWSFKYIFMMGFSESSQSRDLIADNKDISSEVISGQFSRQCCAYFNH